MGGGDVGGSGLSFSGSQDSFFNRNSKALSELSKDALKFSTTQSLSKKIKKKKFYQITALLWGDDDFRSEVR